MILRLQKIRDDIKCLQKMRDCIKIINCVNEILLKSNKNNLESRLQLYLYGDPSINNSDNKNIILPTIKFIKETHRFLT